MTTDEDDGFTWDKFRNGAIDVTIDIAMEGLCLVQDLMDVSSDLSRRGRARYGKVMAWFCHRYPT